MATRALPVRVRDASIFANCRETTEEREVAQPELKTGEIIVLHVINDAYPRGRFARCGRFVRDSEKPTRLSVQTRPWHTSRRCRLIRTALRTGPSMLS